MTTSCRIYAGTYPKALQVPLEAINSEHNKTFVYKKAGHSTLVKQEVWVGAVSETHALVYGGLKQGESVCLTMPADTAGMAWWQVSEALVKKPLTVENANWKARWKAHQEQGTKDQKNERSFTVLP